MQRFDRLHSIQQLDPVQDCCEICCLVAGYEFPWDMTRALEIALFRTFCVPSISKLLDATGDFQHHPQKHDFYGNQPQRSYPKGYRLSDLEPPTLLHQLNQTSNAKISAPS